MTDEQYYQMRNDEGDVKVWAAEPVLLAALRRGHSWLRSALARRRAVAAEPRALTDTTSASDSSDARAA